MSDRHCYQVGILFSTGEIFQINFDICSFPAIQPLTAANDTTRVQINNIPEKSHVIIINKQGQMISRMRVLKIQDK